MKDEEFVESIRHAKHLPNSFYLYDGGMIDARAEQMKKDFHELSFFYSVKANPAPWVVRRVLSHGFGADAASLAEVKAAQACGLAMENIHYSAPGKSEEDIAGALGCATLIADSKSEVELTERIAAARGVIACVGLRINPDFTFDADRGVPSKFGMDERDALDLMKKAQHKNVRIIGLHVHLRSQELRADALLSYYEKLFHLACRAQAALGERLQFVNMGSGLGIAYAKDDVPLDTCALGQAFAALRARFSPMLSGTRLIMETGRFVVGPCGVYAAKVLDRKTSMGKTYVILHNTLNGFMRPCLAQLMQGSQPREPLYTKENAFRFLPVTDSSDMETVTLCGNLCSANDVMAENISLPVLRRGDYVLVTNAGSYGASLSPVRFSSQPAPKEFLLLPDGRWMDCYNQSIDSDTL